MKSTQLFHERRSPLLRILSEQFELVWVFEKRDDTEGDHRYHCCVAGDEEQKCNLYYVSLCEMAWDELFGDEEGDEVGSGRGEASCYEGVHVGEESRVGI